MSWFEDFADDYVDQTSSWLDRLPGYTGYKDKEVRRATDRALRDEISALLDGFAERIEAVQRSAADDRNLGDVSRLDSAVQLLRSDANRIRSLSYGYAGLFSERPVDESALAQLYLFDKSLLTKATALEAQVAAVETSSPPYDSSSLTSALTDFQRRLKTRSSVIETGEKVKKEKLRESAFAEETDVLESKSNAPSVRLGDAISVLGDDYIVQSLIDIKTSSSVEHFIRLDKTPQRWLWISSNTDRDPAELLVVDDLSATEFREETGVATILIPGERKRTGPATIGTSVGSEQIVHLEVDGFTKTFQARTVHSDDIETYPAAK